MSYTLKYTGAEIDDILDRAVEGGTIDEDLALKAPLESPALTGTPTAPTPAASDNSTKIATTAYADSAAAGAAAAAYPVDSASGSVASFIDGADAIPMKSFVCSIEPIQNLNGQSAPYPPGGGKNKLDLSELASNASVTVTEVNNPSYTFVGSGATNVFVRGASSLKLASSTAYILTGGTSQIAIRIREYDSNNTLLASHITSGSTALSFTTDANLSYCDAYVVIYTVPSTATTIQPVLRLSTEADATFAPYSNECPISGHSGVNAVVAGKNLFNKNTVTEGSYIAADGTIGTSSSFALSDYIKVGGNSNVTLSGNSNWGSAPSVCFFDKDKQYLSGTHPTTSPATLSIPSGAVYMRSSLASSSKNAFQVEIGSTASAYSAYNPTVYPVTFYDGANPLTVYKGSIDLVSGKLPVTWGGKDMGTLTWTYESSQTRFKSETLAGLTDGANAICSLYKLGSSLNALTDGQFFIGATGNMFVKDSRYTDAASFKAAVTGQTVAYPLTTSVTYNLTPTEVLSLLGQNNCYNDCGDTAVDYRADIALYVQKLLGGNVNTLSMSAPTPSLSLGRTGVLLEPEAMEPVIKEDAEPDLAEEEPEAVEEAEE